MSRYALGDLPNQWVSEPFHEIMPKSLWLITAPNYFKEYAKYHPHTLRYKSVGRGIDSELWRLEFILWQLTFPCAVGSTQPLKMSTRIFLGGKGGRCVRVTTLPPSCAEGLVIWSLNRSEPSGPHRQVIGVALPFTTHTPADVFFTWCLNKQRDFTSTKPLR